ncbi:uncharacterized protein LOC124136839 [Haliotis rufescens]|uniref:uncharacterized protein LOC124136839 n=1 Tax=Haliotis rufescens TaxID=6454 RepID=UPI00201EFD67|nr:uncharacterized protein LOC124136839 [Haliotis rufescens]
MSCVTGVDSNKHIDNRQGVGWEHSDLSRTMASKHEKLQRLSDASDNCLEKLDVVVGKLYALADELDVQQKKMDIAKISFASSGLVGGGLAIAGFGLSFVTFGASLILTAVGTGIAVASGAGGIATTIAEKIVKSNRVKEAKEAVREYSSALADFVLVLEVFSDALTHEEQTRMLDILQSSSIDGASSEDLFSDVQDNSMAIGAYMKAHKILKAAKIVDATVGAIEIGAKTGLHASAKAGQAAADIGGEVFTAGKEAFRALGTAAKVIKVGGVVLSGVGVIVDVGAIIYYGIKIRKRKPSEIAQMIRKVARSLEDKDEALEQEVAFEKDEERLSREVETKMGLEGHDEVKVVE